MDRNRDVNIGTDVDPGITPESKWIPWAIWSGIALVMALLAVVVAGMDDGLLLGWVVGVIISAMLILFRR